MKTVDEAMASLNHGQALLEQVTADVPELDRAVELLIGAAARVRELNAYYRGEGQQALEIVLAANPVAITPPVANEDAAWEASGDVHQRFLFMLRAVTDALCAYAD